MRWLALAVVLSGCGLLDQDEFTGRRIGDGVAPWRELGALRLCLGTHVVGPPASAPGGLCGDPARVDPPCLDDGDCSSREACVCGRCTVQYCTSNADCGPDRTCTFGGIDGNRCDKRCGLSEECAAGESCFQGRCVSFCDGDGDCQAGEFCAMVGTTRRCAVRACSDDDACTTANHLCKVQREPRVAVEASVLAREAAGEPAFVMYVELSDDLQQDERAIYRAVSEDGVSYRVDPAAPVIDDGGAAHAPSAVRVDGRVYLYYERGDGEELRVASSDDGVQFGAPVTALRASDAMATAVRAPGAVALSDRQVGVYYELGDGAAIGLGRGLAGDALTHDGTALTPGAVTIPAGGEGSPFWLDVQTVRSPYAAIAELENGEREVRLWFSAFGQESGDSVQLGQVMPIPPNYSIGFASATLLDPLDMQPWPYNPVFDRIAVFVDHLSELSPAVVQSTDELGAPREHFLLYFVGADPDVTVLESIGVAENGAK